MSNWLHDLYGTMKRSEKEIALQQRIFREEPDRTGNRVSGTAEGAERQRFLPERGQRDDRTVQ